MDRRTFLKGTALAGVVVMVPDLGDAVSETPVTGMKPIEFEGITEPPAILAKSFSELRFSSYSMDAQIGDIIRVTRGDDYSGLYQVCEAMPVAEIDRGVRIDFVAREYSDDDREAPEMALG